MRRYHSCAYFTVFTPQDVEAAATLSSKEMTDTQSPKDRPFVYSQREVHNKT